MSITGQQPSFLARVFLRQQPSFFEQTITQQWKDDDAKLAAQFANFSKCMDNQNHANFVVSRQNCIQYVPKYYVSGKSQND